MNILALDLATKKTGFAIFRNGELTNKGTIEQTDANVMQRIKLTYNEVKRMAVKADVDYIIVEEVPMQSNNNLRVAHDLCLLQGVILALCIEQDFGLKTYLPSKWRSAIGTYDGTREGRKRNAQKQKAVQITNDMFGFDFKYYERDSIRRNEFSDDDVCEAILIGVVFLKENGLWGKKK